MHTVGYAPSCNGCVVRARRRNRLRLLRPSWSALSRLSPPEPQVTVATLDVDGTVGRR